MKPQTSEAVKILREAGEGKTDPAQLLRSLEKALTHIGHGVPVRILTPLPNGFHRDNLFVPQSLLAGTGLMESGSLGRSSRDGIETDIHAFMAREKIGLLMRAPINTDEPGILIAFEALEEAVPPAFPEAKALRLLADLANSLYTRCRLNLQTQQAEQLAAFGLAGAAITHEIQNPISAISMFGKLVPKLLHDEKFLQEMADVVPGEARRIKVLAEHLLGMAQRPQYSFARVDLNEVVAYVITLSRDQAAQAKVSLTFLSGAPAAVNGDAQALRIALTNLLEIAIERISGAKEQGAIVVRISREGDSIVLEVEDDGPGIPEANRERLFRPSAANGKTDGRGFGLAICAEIARAHQGSITEANRTKTGAVFRLAIPSCA